MVKHENHWHIPTIYYSSIINQYYFIFSLSGQKMIKLRDLLSIAQNMNTSPIDSTIIDYILDHYNILTLQGKPAILTSEQFDDLVKDAEQHYYKKLLKEHGENIRN